MDLRKIGLVLIFIGIFISVMFIGTDYLVPGLTVAMLGFFVTIVGYIEEVKKRKIINDNLDEDISKIIQPLITKYSNLNKQYRAECSSEEYAKKRIQLNKDLEKELKDNLPYFESREIKKIVIAFSKEQDKMAGE